METHGHHLHKAPGKNIWHYFFEFLMLFLAVFTGFLVENFREHRMEKEKGVEYLNSFYIDLKTDTLNFENLILEYEQKISILNSRRDCFNLIGSNLDSKNCMNAIFNASSQFPDLVYTDRTLQQLKNAGGLRLLDRADADKILVYDNLLRQFVKHETTALQETQNEIRSYIFSIKKYNASSNNKSPILLINNSENINHYFNLLDQYEFLCTLNLKDLKEIKINARSIIVYIKDKYHFE